MSGRLSLDGGDNHGRRWQLGACPLTFHVPQNTLNQTPSSRLIH